MDENTRAFFRARVEEVYWPTIWQPLLAEFTGCFLYNFLGCSAAISANDWGYGSTDDDDDTFSQGSTYQTTVSLAFGLTVTVLYAMFEHLSGGYFNPSVTIAMIIARRIVILQGLLYLPVQFVGAICGSAFLKLVMGNPRGRDDVFPTLLDYDDGLMVWQGVLWELFLGFFITLVYLVVTDDAFHFFRYTAAIIIGFAVAAYHFAALFATGASANPARSLGAGIVSLEFQDIWVYIIMPPIGALFATGVHYLCLREEDVVYTVG